MLHLMIKNNLEKKKILTFQTHRDNIPETNQSKSHKYKSGKTDLRVVRGGSRELRVGSPDSIVTRLPKLAAIQCCTDKGKNNTRTLCVTKMREQGFFFFFFNR